jgi:hypothetical protein
MNIDLINNKNEQFTKIIADSNDTLANILEKQNLILSDIKYVCILGKIITTYDKKISDYGKVERIVYQTNDYTSTFKLH